MHTGLGYDFTGKSPLSVFNLLIIVFVCVYCSVVCMHVIARVYDVCVPGQHVFCVSMQVCVHTGQCQYAKHVPGLLVHMPHQCARLLLSCY